MLENTIIALMVLAIAGLSVRRMLLCRTIRNYTSQMAGIKKAYDAKGYGAPSAESASYRRNLSQIDCCRVKADDAKTQTTALIIVALLVLLAAVLMKAQPLG